ncbi:hypothetical protein QJS04_geneDACA002663 [Acorus gramineus]|uniref:Endonuclease/exonuclease/phosphatase domain-containing protein n=1 Tax=Acorus gramineus TaxID=55184 RepID=A0AAV9AU23_ACOGR|nr:hypothetical protein QJS04_geneDACA002663 [Acorus gramineus]
MKTGEIASQNCGQPLAREEKDQNTVNTLPTLVPVEEEKELSLSSKDDKPPPAFPPFGKDEGSKAPLLKNHGTPFVALLENKLVASEVELVKKRIFGHCIVDYSHFHNGRGRIWILWLTKSLNITFRSSSDQYVHSVVTLIDSELSFYVTIVYGSNSSADRQILWADLVRKAPHISITWLVGADFNEVRYTNEKLGGCALQTNRLMNFNSCIGQCNLFDLHATGNIMSWNNRQDNRIACRLDRLMANSEWFNLFLEAYTQYLPGSLSDHASMKLIVTPPLRSHLKPFKFFNA